MTHSFVLSLLQGLARQFDPTSANEIDNVTYLSESARVLRVQDYQFTLQPTTL